MVLRTGVRARSTGEAASPDATGGSEPRTIARSESGLELRVADTILAVEPERWNALVERCAHGGVFHRHEWLAAVESGIGYPAVHFLIEKDGNLIGCCPNFRVDLETGPFRRLTSVYPGFGGPLLPTDVEESLSLLLSGVPERCDVRTVVHEIRASDPDYLRYNDHLREAGYRPVRTGCRFLIDLDRPYEEVRAAMSPGRRRGIECARASTATVLEEPATPENLRRFYGAYERVMDRVGAEGFPRSFFEGLADLDSRVLLLSAWVDGEYAGGMVELRNDERSTIHGLFAAVPEEYFDVHVSELLYDAVIRWGIEHGYEAYDLGDTATDFQDGVFRFKEGFGGELVPNLFWERGTSPLSPLFTTGRSIYWRWRK